MFTILRINKIKTAQGVRDVLDESQRTRPADCKRADPDKLALDTFSGTADAAYQQYWAKLPEKRRKNAVYGLSFVVGASAGFDKFDDFFDDAKKWFDDNFGKDNCIAWAIHRDEATPHMHLVYIPMKDGKLNAKYYVGGSKYRLEDYQKDFWLKVGKKYKLKKPISASETKKKHQTAEEWERDRIAKESDLADREEAVKAREKAVADYKADKDNLVADYRAECKIAETADESSLPKPKALESAKAYEKRVAPVFDGWVQTAVTRKKTLAEQVKETAKKIAEAVSAEKKKWEAVIVEWRQKVETLTAERDALKARVSRLDVNTPAMLRKMADAIERAGCATLGEYRRKRRAEEEKDISHGRS